MIPHPDFSIIIPTYGRLERLAATLRAIERLESTPDSFEVIVVDDGSFPPVVVPESSLRVHMIRQPRRGPASARNRGARDARAPILIFLDDDCAPDRGWLREISRRVRQRRVVVLVCMDASTQGCLDAEP